MATTRSIYLDPTGDGDKVQFLTFGSPPSDWQAISKATRQPSVPSNSTGIQSTANDDLEKINYPAIGAGVINANEYINWFRVWTYVEGTVPANQSFSVALGGVSSVGTVVPTGSSGWQSTPRLSPWLDLSPGTGTPRMATTADAYQATMHMFETSAQAASTQITAQYIEVGLSTMDHLQTEPDAHSELWATDTIAGGAWTYDAGSGTLSVSAAKVVPSSTANKRIIAAGRTVIDGRWTLYADPTATTTNTEVGIIVKRIDANNYIRCTIGGTGVGMRIIKVDGGTPTTLASVAGQVAGDADFTLRVRCEGNMIRLEYHSGLTAVNEAVGVPAQNVRYSLTGADATKFGLGVSGTYGIFWTPHATGERVGAFSMWARKPRLVGMSDKRPVSKLAYTQYGSVAFDDWMIYSDVTGARDVIRQMRARGLDMVRIFIGFGEQMGGYDSIIRNIAPTYPTGGYWRLNEASGTTATDSGAAPFVGANDGTYVNTPTLGATGALTSDPDKAVTFVASGSEELTLPGPATSTNAAIEFWFKWTAGTTLMRASGGNWRIGFDNSGTFAVTIGDATARNTSLATTAVRDGNWHHLVLNKTGAAADVWVDNVKVLTVASGLTNTGAAMPWHVARDGGAGTYADCTFDEIAIYPAALTTAQIALHFTTRSTNPASVVNEQRWLWFENFLDMCVEEDMRLDVTGICTFSGPGTRQVPNWLDVDLGNGSSTPQLTEAQRNAAFQVWYTRCAQACAPCPAVVMYDIANEPLAESGEADWYISTGGFRYGTFLSIARGSRTALEIFHDFFYLMRPKIAIWDAGKAIVMADHGLNNPAADRGVAGENSSMSDIACPHMYLAGSSAPSSPSDWMALLQSTYLSLGRPVLIEEAGLTGSNNPYVNEHFVDFAATAANLSHVIGVQAGWRGALADLASDGSVQTQQRTALIIKKHIKERDRIGPRARDGRAGTRSV